MPEGNISVAEFEKCCEERRKHPIIFKIEYSTGAAGLSKEQEYFTRITKFVW